MDYIKALNNIKEWARKLLIIQYAQAEKNKKTIDLMVDLTFANNLILQIRDLCLSVDKSYGEQLWVVGKWLGIDPYYDAIDLWKQPFSALVNYSNISSDEYEAWQGGFSSYDSSSPYFIGNNDGGFLTYSLWQNTRTDVNIIGDDDFRQLIKLKVIRNHLVYTNKNIDDAIFKCFGGNTYYSNNNISTGLILYSDKELLNPFGKVKSYSSNKIEISKIDDNNDILYSGLFKTMQITENVGDESITRYHYACGDVYTTWQPMKITYHYNSKLHNFFLLATYKNALVAPTGCTIDIDEIEEN